MLRAAGVLERRGEAPVVALHVLGRDILGEFIHLKVWLQIRLRFGLYLNLHHNQKKEKN